MAEKEKKQYKYYTKTISLPDGSRKYIRGRTKAELEERYSKARYELSMGVDLMSKTTFVELAQMWYDLYKKPKLQEVSLTRLRIMLDNHILPALGPLPVRKIKPNHIIDMMNRFGYPSKSGNNYLLGTVRAIFDTAVDNGMIAKSPVPLKLKASGTETKERVPLTPAECAQLLDTLQGKEYLFVVVALNTGMRRGEIFGLRWDCVDFDANKIRVRRNCSWTKSGVKINDFLKTEAGKRDLPMPPSLRALLLEEKAKATSIFVVPGDGGKAMSRTAYARMERVLHTALPGRPLHAHLFRHTYATRLVEAAPLTGMTIKDVQYLLGHSTPEMTMQLYAHYDRETRDPDTQNGVCVALANLAV